jgi:hypothetical protein
MAFSVKVCAVAIFSLFHVFPSFFISLISSFSLLLPAFCAFGVFNSIRLNGVGRGGDLLYLIASVLFGVISYCSSQYMSNHVGLYPELWQLLDYVTNFGGVEFFKLGPQISSIVYIVFSSVAYSVLIITGFYLNFAYVRARNANDAFRYSMSFLLLGYACYAVLSGALFSQGRLDLTYVKAVLLYPLHTLISIITF